MANGTIKIDVLLDTKNIVSDKNKIEAILGGLGKGTGEVMQSDFDKNASRVTSKVQAVDREADKLKNAGSGAGDKISASVDKNTAHVTKRINVTKQEFDKLKNAGAEAGSKVASSVDKNTAHASRRIKVTQQEFDKLKTAGAGAGDVLSRDISKNTSKMDKDIDDFSDKVKRLESDFMGVGNGAAKATKNLNSGFDMSNISIKRLIGSAVALTATLAGIGSFGNLLGRAIGRVDTLDQAEKGIKLLTGSAAETKVVMDGLKKSVEGTPIALDQMAEGAKGLVAVSIEGKKVEGILTAVADASYAVGDGTDASRQQTIDAFKGMASAGIVYTDDLNRLVSSNIPVWGILANKMKKSVSEVKDDVSDGLLDSETAMDILVDGIENGSKGIAGSFSAMGGMAKLSGESFKGAFGNATTALIKSFANIFVTSKEPILDVIASMKKGFDEFSKYTASEEFTNKLNSFIDNIKSFVGFLKDHKETVYAFAKGIGYLVSVMIGLKIIKTVIGWGTSIVGTFTNAGRSVSDFTRRLLGMETNSATSTASVRMLRLEVERLNAALARNQGMSIGAGTGTMTRTAGKTTARTAGKTATVAPVIDTRVAKNAAKSGGKLATVGKFAGKAIPAGMILLSASELIGMTKETAGSHVGSAVGTAGGAWGGAAAGAAIGSVVPGVGTAIGGAVGAGVGAFAGSKYGQEFGEWAQKEFEKTFKPKPKDPLKGLPKETRKNTDTAEDLSNKARNNFNGMDKSESTDAKKILSENEKTYAEIEKLVKKSAETKNKESKANLDRLVKEGYITKEERNKRLEEIEKGNKSELSNSRKSINALKELEKKHANELVEINEKRVEKQQEIDKSYNNQKEELAANKKSELAKAKTEKEKLEINRKYKAQGLKLDREHNKKTAANDNKSEKKRQELTEESARERVKRQAELNSDLAKSLSKSSKEQEKILTKLKNNTETLTEEQASSMIKQSAKQRDKIIKDANKTYKEVKKSAEKKYKDTVAAAQAEFGDSSEASQKKLAEVTKNAATERDETVKAADEQKTEVVKHAKDTHDEVVKQAQEQADGHAKAVDEETGNVLTILDKFVLRAAIKIDGYTAGLNSVLGFFNDEWKNLIPRMSDKVSGANSPEGKKLISHATGGVMKNDHSALVGEFGTELAWDKSTNQARLLGTNGAEITQVKAGEVIYTAQQTAAMMNGGLGKTLPNYANGKGFMGTIKNGMSSAWENITEIPKHIEGWLESPKDKLKDLLKKHTITGNFDIARKMATGTMDKLKDGAENLVETLFEDMESSGGSAPSGKGVQRWRGTVAKALKMNGLPVNAAYVNAWLRQIASESGGNPGAIQGDIGDVNNKSGDIAKGLVQVIGQTFNAYKHPGHNNRLNGLDSLLAGMNYAKATYGTKGMLRVIGHGHGYAYGGKVTKPTWGVVGEAGDDEYIVNPNKFTAPSLLGEAIAKTQQLQPNVVIPNVQAPTFKSNVGASSDNSDIINAILDSNERPINVHVTFSASEMTRIISKSQGSAFINEGAFSGEI